MKNELRAENIQSVQFLRGIAAFLVLLCHSVTTGQYFPSTHIIAKVCVNGWMGVDIFFIISGFIIPYSMYKKEYELSDFRVFFEKRIVRIEPPYVISIVMVLFLNYLNTVTPWYKGPAFIIDWPNVLGHLGYLNAYTYEGRLKWLNWAYWTLAIEFQYYVIIALLYPLITHNNKKILITTFFILLACAFIRIPHVYIMPFKPFDPFPAAGSDSASQILPFLPFFLAGIAMFLYNVRKITLTEFLVFCCASFLVCYYRFGLILFLISILTLLCMNFIKKVPKPFMLLGTISYSLYLTHDVLVSRFQALLERYTKFNIAIDWVLSLVACLVFAGIYYFLVERPFLSLSKKISFKHRSVKE